MPGFVVLLVLLARLTLGAVWVVAGLSKLVLNGPRGRSVAAFGLLPHFAADAVGAVLPIIELSLGLLLLAGQWTVIAAGASACLLIIFSIAITINLIRGAKIECNCFGQLKSSQISWLSVIRNLVLVTLAIIAILVRSNYYAADGWWKGTVRQAADPPIHDFVPVLLLASVGALIWFLGLSTWEALKVIARADDGPALGLTARNYLRRWMGPGVPQDSEGA